MDTKGLKFIKLSEEWRNGGAQASHTIHCHVICHVIDTSDFTKCIAVGAHTHGTPPALQPLLHSSLLAQVIACDLSWVCLWNLY